MSSPQKPNPGSSSGTAATPILGVLMLKTAFPRLPGDVGHPDTWSVPTRYRVVETATDASVVKRGPLPLNLLLAFIDAAWTPVEEGDNPVTPSRGLLVTAPKALAAALPVPVVRSTPPTI